MFAKANSSTEGNLARTSRGWRKYRLPERLGWRAAIKSGVRAHHAQARRLRDIRLLAPCTRTRVYLASPA